MAKNQITDQHFVRSIYKNSNTFIAVSRTLSVYSHSGFVKAKKRHSKTSVRPVKLDSCVETCNCKLRRKIMRQRERNKLNGLQRTSRTKFSEVNDDNTKVHREFSACGDNDNALKNVTDNFNNLDIESLLIHNFNTLLYKLVHNYVAEDKDTKEKIQNTLETVIHRICRTETKKSTSSSTFVINLSDYTSKNMLHTFAKSDIANSSCCSYYTIPISNKKVRIISTLSIPREQRSRKSYMRNTHKRPCFKTNRKINKINDLPTVENSSKLLSVRNSLKENDNEDPDRIVYRSNTANKSTNKQVKNHCKRGFILNRPRQRFSSNDKDKPGVNDMPSLVKSIYAGNNFEMNNDCYKNELTEQRSIPTTVLQENIKIETGHVDEHNTTSCVMKDVTLQTYNHCDTQCDLYTISDIMRGGLCFGNLKNKSKELNRNQHQFTRRKSYRKKHYFRHTRAKQMFPESNIAGHQGEDIINYFNNIIQYFAKTTGFDNKFKFDVQINIVPTSDKTVTENEGFIKLHEEPVANPNNLEGTLHGVQTKIITRKVFDDTKSVEAECIPILDGSMSYERYFYDYDDPNYGRNEKETQNETHTKGTTTHELEVLQDIQELKSVIKNLAIATERFLEENFTAKKETNANIAIVTLKPEGKHTIKDNKTKKKARVSSKGIQLSNIHNKNLSGIKLKIDANRNGPDNARKCLSYHIAESESIIKVTDMTSKADTEINQDAFAHTAITCSLPEVKYLYETDYNLYTKDDKSAGDAQIATELDKISTANTQITNMQNEQQCYSCKVPNTNPCGRPKMGEEKSSTSIVIQITDRPAALEQAAKLKMSRWVAFIFCLLLWIPMAVVIYLLVKESKDKKANVTETVTVSMKELGF